MLTSKQRAFLKGLSTKVDTTFQIGKGGLNENQIKEFEIALEKHELVKVHVLENSFEDPRAVCDEVVAAIDGCEPVFVIGKRFVIYRQSKEHKRIDLKNLCVREIEKKTAPSVTTKNKLNGSISVRKSPFGAKKTGVKGARGGFGTKKSHIRSR